MLGAGTTVFEALTAGAGLTPQMPGWPPLVSSPAVVNATKPEPSADSSENPPRRIGWLLAFLGFFLVIGAWSVAAPYDATPDEKEHVIRAAGVAAGQIVTEPSSTAMKGGGAFQEVPNSLVRTNCFKHEPERSAACGTDPGGDETVVEAGTGAGRYHPLYYILVGWPLALSPDWTGLLLARLITAALSAALLATALIDAMRWSRFRLMAAGALAATTPMVMHMASAVNPSGVEIAAGIAFFAAAIPLLFASGAGRSRTLLWHVGVAALALATLRTAGPLWLALSVVALLIPWRWQRLRELWQWRPVRWWTLTIGLATAACMTWTLIFKTNAASDVRVPQLSLGQSVRKVVERWDNYLAEMVGVTGWLDTYQLPPVYLIWHFATAALIIWGFVLAGRGGQIRLLAIAASGIVLPSLMQVVAMNIYGFIMQGRYLLPLLVGLPLLASFLIQQYGFPHDKSQTFVRMLAVLLLPLHLVVLAYTMVRWQRGLDPDGGFSALNPLSGEWQPPLGPIVPLLAATLGIILIGWLVWSSPNRFVLPAFATRAVSLPTQVAVSTSDGKTAEKTSTPEAETHPAGSASPAAPAPSY